jgi:hypothetical protein
MLIGGYKSVRLSTIWAEDRAFYNHHYVPHYLNFQNRLVVFLADNELELDFDHFSRKIESKVTGHYRIEKTFGKIEKEITKLAAWNVVSERDKPDAALTLVEVTLVNNNAQEIVEYQLFEPELRQKIQEVRWLDCKYHKTDDFYCFANLKLKG